ncbi:arylamine N-acetyltransferase [Streptomyces sp. NBC_00103]|uniref:arylamine N-acetyltransferase family protein n=1 Tax=Streptomyces sp. NBC_00103 TaxID=2975653 RepID=UPI0022568349|nr:arylamine N-acetyltransferase [Streptomyces sp. NBC_00103]MCX5373233.1 arylamine N-acetyltransferase [Streptomyces sp. NBC_00103]
MPGTTAFGPDDLDSYLRRIGWEGERRADAATLRGVHLAHSRAIPFENLDPLRGTVPSLVPADLIAKLVRGGRRGGYCYEHNMLLAGVLEALGFGVTLLTARVVVGAQRFEERPRTHMALLVEVPGDPRPYLADVGFGAPGALLEAVPLTAEVEFHDAGRRHRLVHAPHRGPLELWVLQAHAATAGTAGTAGVSEAPGTSGESGTAGTSGQSGTAGEPGTAGASGGGVWQAQYAFTLEPFERPDFEVINWHIATNPRSPFSSRAYVQRSTSDRHLLLNGPLLTETHPDGTVKQRELTDETEARRVLDEEFGIAVPDGTRLLP